MAFLCLPRQFHAAVVEHGHPAQPAHRALAVPELPRADQPVRAADRGGRAAAARAARSSADLYVLQLPLGHGASWLSALVFIGGLSAATSMVVVACMALSAMIGNELLMPYVLRQQGRWNLGGQQQMGALVVFVRRAAVVLILMAGYAYERVISGVAAARLDRPDQLLRRVQLRARPGARSLLAARPSLRRGRGPGRRLRGLALRPAAAQPACRPRPGRPRRCRRGCRRRSPTLDPVGQGFVVGILVNTLLLVGVSLLVRARGADAEQADAFVLRRQREPEPPAQPAPADAQRLAELRELLARFVGAERAGRRWERPDVAARRRWRRPSACCRAPWARPRRA